MHEKDVSFKGKHLGASPRDQHPIIACVVWRLAAASIVTAYLSEMKFILCCCFCSHEDMIMCGWRLAPAASITAAHLFCVAVFFGVSNHRSQN